MKRRSTTDREQLVVLVPPELKRRVREAAATHDLTMAQAVRRACALWLETVGEAKAGDPETP